jgi:hypothetical protein
LAVDEEKVQTCAAHSPHRPPIRETELLNTDPQMRLNQLLKQQQLMAH